jgi:ribosomal protein S18 acetylase RimI-like enzyme
VSAVADLRILGVGDEEQLKALFTAVDLDAGIPPTVEASRAFVADPSSFAIGAYVEDAAVGLAWGIQMLSPLGRLTTYLHQLDVLEAWRRRGIGTGLVLAAMDLGRRQGSTRFWLSTGGHNEVAQSLYASLGGERKPQGDVNYWWQLD